MIRSSWASHQREKGSMTSCRTLSATLRWFLPAYTTVNASFSKTRAKGNLSEYTDLVHFLPQSIKGLGESSEFQFHYREWGSYRYRSSPFAHSHHHPSRTHQAFQTLLKWSLASVHTDPPYRPVVWRYEESAGSLLHPVGAFRKELRDLIREFDRLVTSSNATEPTQLTSGGRRRSGISCPTAENTPPA